ncbi:hypothetical protein MYCTH_93590 [Thermothelomyces thermophilus ATCC 42464]|uniref:Uncharacterized protein n=1 Tax=Thermothelomyces thermophilus (strain ATCC 42464 / BCRC 31852 / DSM 1799) TaxID=573729 RepID=G2QD11_THET4|nr:uncharacterized protein MYCTH_93590 [Thermothelomyces thermophilus ATCC 42464]AEO58229.1 hypothetical protein MYCTH_93590 [Thermothelomyces thermophilus ATCC 42464]
MSAQSNRCARCGNNTADRLLCVECQRSDMVAGSGQADNYSAASTALGYLAQPGGYYPSNIPANPYAHRLRLYPQNHGDNDSQLTPSESWLAPPPYTPSAPNPNQQLAPQQPVQGFLGTPQVGFQLPAPSQGPWVPTQGLPYAPVAAAAALAAPNNPPFLGYQLLPLRFGAAAAPFGPYSPYQTLLAQRYHLGYSNNSQTSAGADDRHNDIKNQGQQNLNLYKERADNQGQSDNGNNDNDNDGEPAPRPLGTRGRRNAALVARGLCIWCRRPNPDRRKKGCPTCLPRRAGLTAEWRRKRKAAERRRRGELGDLEGEDEGEDEGGREDGIEDEERGR